MTASPIFKDLVLVGGGHSHALVLRKWAMNPLPGVRITLISPQAMTPYSGMLPGLIAGHYQFEQTHIDLVKLSTWAQIRFIQDSVTGIDTDNNTLQLAGRPSIQFDVVSIDIGSTPDQSIEGSAEYSTPIKPISDFLLRWHSIQKRVSQNKITSLSVVGGGAGSVEVILALACKLTQMDFNPEYHLLTASREILSGYNRFVRNRALDQLAYYRIHVHTSTRVEKLSQGMIHCFDAAPIHSDEIIWCTQAAGSTWLRQSEIECSPAGFIKVRPTLQSLRHNHIFAAGDIADMIETPRPKAGVYAVRQAPVLFHNLRAVLLDQDLLDYTPQDGFLSLLALGEKKATGSKSFISFSGAWVWRWKDSIDRKFMDLFHQLPALPMRRHEKVDSRLIETEERDQQHDPAKRCAGCGAKISATILQQVLNEILGEQSYQPQDAVQITSDADIVFQSVDALKTPIQDIWLFGKIAVNHALSDLYAMNLVVDSAQILVTLPYAGDEIQRRQLITLMQGILSQFESLHCRFLGGHTSEGEELSVGLVVNGLQKQHNLFHKYGLTPGDKLVLSKPLGSGVILAAAMQARCKSDYFNRAIDTLLQANDHAAQQLSQLQVKACTDVSGFGLLGHLHEMCVASGCNVRLNLNAVPLLAGAEILSSEQIKSTLYRQNRMRFNTMAWADEITRHPRFPLLFDPQTSGGLLAGVPEKIYSTLDQAFHQQFYTIGEVSEYDKKVSYIQIE